MIATEYDLHPYADLRGEYVPACLISRRVNLRNADCREIEFQITCSLEEADFSEADLRDARISDCNLNYAIFRNSDLRRADLSCSDLIGANFEGAKIDETTNFTKSHMDIETFRKYFLKH
jgi:uncharacterized protein YjbI with pentapeptide repeats